MTNEPITYDEALARLTAPGSPLELRIETMGGVPVRSFAARPGSLRELVARAGERGEREFLVQGDRRLSYGEFARLVWGTAEALRRHGLAKGDRLAILAYNSPEYAIATFAAASIGAIVVALNGWWVEAELEYALRDSGSRFLIVDDRLLPRVHKLVGKLDDLEKVFLAGKGAVPAGFLSLREQIQPSDHIPEDAIAEDDPFVILYTSGTTGRPKGCITTHRGTITQVMGILLHGMLAAAQGEASPLPHDGSQPTALLTAPMFHVAGIHTGLCTAMTAGAKVVLSEGRFDPEQVLALIEKERITTWSSIPTMLHRVVYCPTLRDYDLSSLTRIAIGGAATPPDTLARARAVLPVEPSLTNGYGLTETHGIVMMCGGADLEAYPTAVGRPSAFFDVRLVDAAGRDVADGELGQILLRGPTLTPGYWRAPEATAETIRDGWFYTGDLAYRDERGLYHVVDRTKDMILRGGENVYCVEIENRIAEHPAVDEVAVIGVPDEELGERVKAVVRLRPGASLDEAELRRHVAERLAAFKVPEQVEFRDTPLPRNPAGKVLKDQLRGRGTGAFDPELLG